MVCVVVIVIALSRNSPGFPPGKPGPPTAGPPYPTTRVTSTQPTPYYKNCREAHADGRWDIPEGDPAYRPALDGDHNGLACESPKSRRGAR